MRLLTEEKGIARDLLNASLEEDWERFRIILRDTGIIVSLDELWRCPTAEEAIIRAIKAGDLKVLQMLITRDRLVANNCPELKSLRSVETITVDAVQDYKWYALFRAMQGLGQHVMETVESDPHEDVAYLLVRMGGFPDTRDSYRHIMHQTLGEVLKCSSLLGLENTIGSLRKDSEMMTNTVIARMLAEPLFLGKANLLFDRGFIEDRVLRAIRDVAIVEGLHPASLEWLNAHIRGDDHFADDDDEVVF